MVNPIDFGCQSSNVKVTMGIIDKCGFARGCYALRCYILSRHFVVLLNIAKIECLEIQDGFSV